MHSPSTLFRILRILTSAISLPRTRTFTGTFMETHQNDLSYNKCASPMIVRGGVFVCVTRIKCQYGDVSMSCASYTTGNRKEEGNRFNRLIQDVASATCSIRTSAPKDKSHPRVTYNKLPTFLGLHSIISFPNSFLQK